MSGFLNRLDKFAPQALQTIDMLDKFAPQAIDAFDKLASKALAQTGLQTPGQAINALDKFASRALAQTGIQTPGQRRAQAAALSAAEAAREKAAQEARRAQVAEKVNQPFLRGMRSWTKPESLQQQPDAVRQALTEARDAAWPVTDGIDADAVAAGRISWADAAPATFDHLLKVAETATKAKDSKLSLRVTKVLLAARSTSRASWRQRALAAELAGDLPTAIQAHRSYLEFTQSDRLGIMGRMKVLEERDARRQQLIIALNTALKNGDSLASAPRVRKMMEVPTPRRTLDRAVARLRREMAELPMEELLRPAVQDVLYQVTRWGHHACPAPAPLPDDDVDRLAVLRRHELRQRLAGRRLCLIHGAPERLRGSGQGENIENYDVVVRFGPSADSLTGASADSGSRTDLQVIRHDSKIGWDTETDLRMILADRPEDWTTAVRSSLIPGKQHAVIGKALCWPLRHPVLVGETGEPTDAYQLLRLLDLLAACEAVDLIGFDPENDFTEAELAWLQPRLEQRDDHSIGVR